MKMDVRCRNGVPHPVSKEYVESLIPAAFSRFRNEIDWIMWRFEDVNGPRGGNDQCCRVTIFGPRCGLITTHYLHAHWQVAALYALRRAARLTRATLQRTRVLPSALVRRRGKERSWRTQAAS